MMWRMRLMKQLLAWLCWPRNRIRKPGAVKLESGSDRATIQDDVKVMTMPSDLTIPLCEPYLAGNEWDYVKSCLDTNWVSSVGAYVGRFEEDVAHRAGAAHGIATVNGTAALHIALLVAGVAPDDEVLVSTLTFVASANAIRHAGAWPVTVDAEPDYWQMDLNLLEAFLADGCERRGEAVFNRDSGRRVAAIMPVHVNGHPVDMPRLTAIAQTYGLPVVEDATEALGSRVGNRPVGSIGLLGCFSFNGNKLITTGGGGMIVTDDEELALRARHLTTQARVPGPEYIHDEVGYNYRLTNIQSAIGCAQMEQLDDYIAAKHRIAARYDAAFAELPGLSPQGLSPDVFSNRWMYCMTVDPNQCGLDSRALLERLNGQGIQGRPIWQPLHLSPAHAGCQSIGGSVADRIYRQTVSLPCSVSLDEAQQQRVIDAVLAAVKPEASSA
jgi:perosamine synthetase